MTVNDLFSLTPFLIIAIAPVIIMLVISVIRNYRVVYWFSVVALIFSFCSLFIISPVVPHAVEPLLIIDNYSLFFSGIIIISALLVTFMSYSYIRRFEGIREEYYLAIFTATLGALLLAAASHFVILFLGLETLSISLYIMIAFRKTDSRSVEAGIKYLILASVSSAFLLFGMALIYNASGSMKFSGIIIPEGMNGKLAPMVLAGFVMMLTGIGFKLALVPFHMWTPDVYQGAPVPVSAYVATVSKGAVMAVLIRLFFTLKGFSDNFLFVIISILAILSMFIGNILAIRQKNLKRLLGYSSISNMGYLVIILLTGTAKGIQAAVFYLVAYFITTLGAFGVISLLSTKDHEAENVEDYKGLFWKRPAIALAFTLALLSLAGIPVTAGFIAKFYVILEGINSGLMVLVLSLVINSVIGLYYYLRVITVLFSDAGETVLPEISTSGFILLSLISCCILVLGIYPSWIIDLIVRFVFL